MNSRNFAIVVAALVALSGLALVIERGGLIAWLALILGSGLLLKAWRKPASKDLGLGLGLVAILGVAWFGTLNYVVSTWESGEVVELTFDTSQGTHTARLWVLDVDDQPILYYDAPPFAAQALLAQTPVQFTRAGEVSTLVPHATEADALPEDEANQLLELMQTTYGERNSAAMFYYGLLGRARDRVALVVRLAQS